MDEHDFEGWTPKTVSVEFPMDAVSPETLAIMTGGVLDYTPTPLAVTVVAPIKRRWWEWLLRKPRRYATIYIPNARMRS